MCFLCTFLECMRILAFPSSVFFYAIIQNTHSNRWMETQLLCLSVCVCVCVCECVCVCKCHIYWHNVFSGLFSGFSNTPINKSVILSILKYLYCTLSLTILSIPLCVCAEACFGQIKSVPFGEAIAHFTFYESPTHSLSTFI